MTFTPSPPPKSKSWKDFKVDMMENKPLSEHIQKLRFSTVIPVLVVCLMLLTFISGIGCAFYMYVNGQKITWSDGILVICGGGIIAIVCGIAIARYLRRMLSVRKVLLFENDRIEIVTWRNKIFTAKLPDNIKHILVSGANFSVTFKIENRYFIVDSEQFFDKDGINEFFRRFVERCQTHVR
jgi:hypothetical protein